MKASVRTSIRHRDVAANRFDRGFAPKPPAASPWQMFGGNRRSERTVHVGELANSRDKDTPTALRDSREDWLAAFAVGSPHAGKPPSKAWPAPVDRKSRRAEPDTARAYVVHAPLEIGSLHIRHLGPRKSWGHV